MLNNTKRALVVLALAWALVALQVAAGRWTGGRRLLRAMLRDAESAPSPKALAGALGRRLEKKGICGMEAPLLETLDRAAATDPRQCSGLEFVLAPAARALGRQSSMACPRRLVRRSSIDGTAAAADALAIAVLEQIDEVVVTHFKNGTAEILDGEQKPRLVVQPCGQVRLALRSDVLDPQAPEAAPERPRSRFQKLLDRFRRLFNPDAVRAVASAVVAALSFLQNMLFEFWQSAKFCFQFADSIPSGALTIWPFK